jgi:hypothetical protein
MTTLVTVVEIQGLPGPLNTALNVWNSDQASAITPAEVTARILAFTTAVLAQTATECSVVSVRHGLDDGPLTYVDWPTGAITIWNDDAAAPVYEVQQTGFGDVITGNGASAALGTSITVTEQTAAGGRHNGRKFIPWTAASSLTAAGAISLANTAFIQDVYTYCCLGINPADGAAIPGGYDPLALTAGVADSPIVQVRVSPRPARLRSRMR